MSRTAAAIAAILSAAYQQWGPGEWSLLLTAVSTAAGAIIGAVAAGVVKVIQELRKDKPRPRRRPARKGKEQQ